MKKLNNYISEWKASSTTVSSIKKSQYFVYKLNKRDQIKIFDRGWPQFADYIDKVYIDDKQIAVGSNGWTIKNFEPGTYIVDIKDIDNITNCKYMFFACKELIKISLFDTSNVENMDEMFSYCENIKDVPLFNTSKVNNMFCMFSNCKNLIDVPLFDIHNVENMSKMFDECHNLSEQTKREWSKVYNFEHHEIKK